MGSQQEQSTLCQATTRKKRSRCMKLIEDEKSRSVSYEKRKATLKKKAGELATLCDVTVCMVFFGPDGDGKVETLPENKTQVQEVFKKYKEQEKVKDSGKKKKQDLIGFLESNKGKLEDKLETKNKGVTTNILNLLSSCYAGMNHLSEEALIALCYSLQSKLQILREKIQLLQMEENTSQNYSNIHGLHMAKTNLQCSQPSPSLGFDGECSDTMKLMLGHDQPAFAEPVNGASLRNQCYLKMKSSNNSKNDSISISDTDWFWNTTEFCL